MRKWLVGLMVLAASIVGMVAGVPNAHAASSHYTITTDTTFPPFEFQTQGGDYRGIDMDMLKEIAKREDFTYTLKPMSFNAGVQAVQAGQVDGILAGMSITDERKQTFDFGTPYYKSGIVMAVANKSKVDSLDDLKGKTVAAKTGSSGAMYAQRMAKKYDFKITYFNDSNTMYNDVIIGNTVAAFEDQPVMAYAIQQGTKMKIVTDPADGNWYGFGVKKGDNAELLKKFNEGYAKIVKDGTYDKIVNRYLGEGGYNYKENAAAKSAADQSIWSLIQENKAALLDGLIKTLQLTVVGIVLAAIWGVLLGVMGVAPSKLVRGISSTIIYIFRGLPMLVLAFFIYIGIPNLTGQKIPAFTAGVITLILNEGAYIGAFVRGGFKSVDPGQLEAARSLGMPYGKAMRKVVMPQGIRLTIPSFINQFIITLKDTSILSAIGIIELTQTGTLIIARNLQGFKVWLMIAVLYLIVITLLTWLSNWVEKRIN
ncbi:ABC transporter permease subunit [Weissella confusa]|jgi:amine acid ABC transporter, permease protein, 3-TM region, His/Glu/Gln/Arg/opine family|uniref:ABC transporter substrate-binding protein/permease n=1 Tax=Weissella confusa TaxID=1583 RepID=A0A4Z0RD28_WEICO|nr:ABC transporter substrate-binding protein/permease [Weissella confusa]COI75874.1 glutamine ABC transporter glutamine-binding protein/permease [Streptococcus pneumoniae]MBA5933483.1 ABC transporter substrate-binding protein/permease [Weissella confusa]MBD5833830.1 ABC transporter permease subunit [Weissella confusa]MBF7056501.1 ABC transporter substrate-binding protein/permease [Weissella confusa]MBJ7616959.1 ABC transporter substrate-binding protein/permease [Weissella confusa]